MLQGVCVGFGISEKLLDFVACNATEFLNYYRGFGFFYFLVCAHISKKLGNLIASSLVLESIACCLTTELF